MAPPGSPSIFGYGSPFPRSPVPSIPNYMNSSAIDISRLHPDTKETLGKLSLKVEAYEKMGGHPQLAGEIRQKLIDLTGLLVLASAPSFPH